MNIFIWIVLPLIGAFVCAAIAAWIFAKMFGKWWH